MKRARTGGGWAAIRSTLRMASRVGWWRLWKAMRTKNACKTCALGMGGQAGSMRNEAGHWPEVCKKSLQAMVADMQKGIEPAFFAKYSIAQLRTLSSRELESCGRLTAPLYAGPDDSHYRVIDWDTALERIARQLRDTPPEQHFFYASGRSSTEAGFLLQLLARLCGSNYVNNCSYYCHQASAVGLGQALGTATATVTLEDVENTDLFFLLGGNPASNHPRLMTSLMKVRRRGGQIVVINPVKEVGLVNFSVPSDLRSLLFGTRIASHYLQPHIGGDIALMTGIARWLIENTAIDAGFLTASTEGFAEFRDRVLATPWELIERASGEETWAIQHAARMYAQARSAVFAWTMGITQHMYGVENVRMIANLALLRGMVGRPRAGLLPIRGHSNVQGMGTVGVSPALRQQVLDNLEKHLGVSLPRSPGLDTMGCMKASDAGRMRAAVCLGGNLFGANPDARFAKRAIEKLELVTYLSTSLNTGHAWGRGRETIVLPVRARDEEPEPTTQESMFNFVRLSDGGLARLDGPRREVDVITAIARRVLGQRSAVDWDQLGRMCHVREMIARIVPGLEGLADIDQTKKEFHIPGRAFHTPQFRTPTGKARFAAVAIPELSHGDRELRLMTVRSEGQFNTVVYEEQDIYRGQERRDVVLLHPDDIARLGLEVDQRVTVRSAAGYLSNILVRALDVRPGNAVMYYPEANVLVPAATDPQSHTPAFKSVLVTIETGPPDGPAPGGARRPLQMISSP
jgi:molybdopterin-dependent oxidoreductase alpha subunit